MMKQKVYTDRAGTQATILFSAREEGSLASLLVYRAQYPETTRGMAIAPIIAVREGNFFDPGAERVKTLPLVRAGSQGQSKLEYGLYQHYKGREYTLICFGTRAETMDDVIVYQARYIDEELGAFPIFVRSLRDFEGAVSWQEKTVQRFTFLGK